MTSTGNDIVAFSAINIARTNQEKFYLKILSPTEQALYSQPGFEVIPFENFVWLLWSIKESAFKFLQRLSPGLIFTPVKFEVQQLLIPAGYKPSDFNGGELTGNGFTNQPVLNGIILVKDYTLHSCSLVYNQLVLSVVNDNENFQNTHWGVKAIETAKDDIQSKAIREFLTSALENIGITHPSIGKNQNGIPFLLNGEKETAIPVSLSHHGCFIAYSFQQP